MSIEKIAQEVIEELKQAEKKFAGFNSSHEGYAVILEELDELWDVVKLNPKKIDVPDAELAYKSQIQKLRRNQLMRGEAIQVAAMAIRFVKCICDEEDE